MGKKTGLIILTLLVAACLCLSAAGILGAGVVIWNSSSNSVPLMPQPTGAVNPALPVGPTNVPAFPPVWTATPSSGNQGRTAVPGKTATPDASTGNLSAVIGGQMDAIQQQVTLLRGLKPNGDFRRGLLTNEQLRKKVLEDFFVDYSRKDADDDTLVLSLFGLLPPGYDLYQLYVDLYSEQVAGYYDSKTREMYVVLGKNFGGTERSTYAHEYNHALQDQNYSLREGLKLKQEYCDTHTEYCAAVTSLIEGDSVLTEQLWVTKHATIQDLKDMQEFQRTYKSPVYDSSPAFLQEDFLFPYTRGFEFVKALYDRGGFNEVDKAFRNPPVTTSQIMHPEKYPSSKPAMVELPDLRTLLGQGWTEVDRNSLGEWYTYLVLAKGNNSRNRVSDRTASQAAGGWMGDQYVVYTHNSLKPVLVQQMRWEKATDVTEFASAFSQYGQLRWGKNPEKQGARLVWQGTPEGIVVFAQNGLNTLWLMAPDKAVVDQLLGTMKGF